MNELRPKTPLLFYSLLFSSAVLVDFELGQAPLIRAKKMHSGATTKKNKDPFTQNNQDEQEHRERIDARES